MNSIPSLVLVSLASAAPAIAQENAHPLDSIRLGDGIEWISDGAEFRDGRRAKRALTEEELATDRSAMIDEAVARARSEGKLVLWYVPRIIEQSSSGRQMYRAPMLDTYMHQLVFSDPDVTNIIDSGFVAANIVADEPLCERFSFRPLEYIEPAVVFLDQAGRVVHTMDRIRTFDALWFAGVLCRVQDKAGTRPSGQGKSVTELTSLGLFEQAYDELDATDQRSVADLIQLGSLARRLRRPAKALAHFEEARAALQLQAGSSGGRRRGRAAEETPEARARRLLQRDLDYEHGRMLSWTGERTRANRMLDAAFRADHAEAGYLMALNLLAEGNHSAALRQFQLVSQGHRDTVSGQKALANLTLGADRCPLGAAFSGDERIGYLPEQAYQGLPRDTRWIGPPSTPDALAARAVRHLLSAQRSDGGFVESRYAYWGSGDYTTNVWVAVTALACSALLEFRDRLPHDQIDPAAIDEALRRGESFLLDPGHLRRGLNEDVYSDAYRLLYFARVVRKQTARAEWARTRMNQLIVEAQGRQADTGFFAHEYSNAFCTAPMIWALLEAKEAGATVPEELIAKGSMAIESARYDNGAYSYGGAARSGGEGSLKDACGRMPICEGVQLRTGPGNGERLEFAMKNYWQFYDRLEKVRRNDFHSDGELAGFFFSHDLLHTAQVLPLVPEALRGPAQQRFLEVIQGLPEIDGTFVDSHEFGRSYATAAALLALVHTLDG